MHDLLAAIPALLQYANGIYIVLTLMCLGAIAGLLWLLKETRTSTVQNQDVLIQNLMDQNKSLTEHIQQLWIRQAELELQNQHLQNEIIAVRKVLAEGGTC